MRSHPHPSLFRKDSKCDNCDCGRPEWVPPLSLPRCDNCMVDNLAGEACDIVKEAYCPNQCSGHGECNLGFCKCYEGW